jgi:hypothetical protein
VRCAADDDGTVGALAEDHVAHAALDSIMGN